MVAPILEELKDEYGDKLDIFKVNTEDQRELSSVFGIQSIPSLLFIPKDGQPQMAMGALPKETFKQAISEVLSVEANKHYKNNIMKKIALGIAAVAFLTLSC